MEESSICPVALRDITMMVWHEGTKQNIPHIFERAMGNDDLQGHSACHFTVNNWAYPTDPF